MGGNEIDMTNALNEVFASGNRLFQPIQDSNVIGFIGLKKVFSLWRRSSWRNRPSLWEIIYSVIKLEKGLMEKSKRVYIGIRC